VEQLDRARDLAILISLISHDLSYLMELASFAERKCVARCFSYLQRQILHLAREKGAVSSHSGTLLLSEDSTVRMLIICFSDVLASAIIDLIKSGSLTK
jgi:hypothetical protein